MTCADCLESLGSFVDGELPADHALLMAEHLEGCADCAAAHRQLVETSSLLKAGLVRYQTPDVLRARIRANLAAAAREVSARPARLPVRWGGVWTRTIAAAAAVAVISSGLTFAAMRRQAPGNEVRDEVLASHIRSLMPGHLTDVASNDQHNVKPWFNGRVNMSPDVPRLDSLGFPLIGGRVDYIDGRSVASVVYTRRQHVINVFSWAVADQADIASEVTSSNGYHIVHARRNGTETWIVSDVNLPELRNFARMVIPER